MRQNVTAARDLLPQLLALGAYKAAVIPVRDMVLDASFRQLCAANSCGMYGRCWMCPPDVGEIHQLMDRVHSFGWALVYQTVGQLEDSYDIEGMQQAAVRHNALLQQVRALTAAQPALAGALHLGAGSCQVCPRCARADGAPCRFPDQAVPSLEAHGINVSQLAAACGMRYINGQNTVTYFGAVLFGTAEKADGEQAAAGAAPGAAADGAEKAAAAGAGGAAKETAPGTAPDTAKPDALTAGGTAHGPADAAAPDTAPAAKEG